MFLLVGIFQTQDAVLPLFATRLAACWDTHACSLTNFVVIIYNPTVLMFVDIIEAPKLYWHYAETLFHAATYPLN